MRLKSLSPFVFVLLFFVSGCAANKTPYRPDFNFKHTKAERCDEFWLSIERLVKNSGARCTELLQIDGFPYLRGTPDLLKAGMQFHERKAIARWLELMRSADMQARYRELAALADSDWAILCSEAGIANCEEGRLKAYMARCSALLLGDERLNQDFNSRLAEAIPVAIERGYPSGKACFSDRQTLDGTLPPDLLKAISRPASSYKGGAVLEQRVNRMKAMSIRGAGPK